MRKYLLGLVATGSFLVAPLTLSVAQAASAEIENAKSSCIIGEQSNGYLGVVSGATADDSLRRAVRETNQQRKAAYARLAESNGVSIDVAAALTAEKLINQLRSGQCYRDAGGRWVKV